MSQYKFVYFDVAGLGESIRLQLHYVGQSFDDVRLTQEKFAKLKPSLKYGQVPYLEVDGKKLYQSAAIARYLAEKFDLAGKSEWERAKVNELVDFFNDFYKTISEYTYVVLGYREGDKAKLRETVYLPSREKYFSIVEKVLKESGSGFLSQSGLTFVDFRAAEFFRQLEKIEPNIFDGYSSIEEYKKRFFALPQLKEYLSKHQ